jgi:Skp family chaperone for outer membrane proteins
MTSLTRLVSSLAVMAACANSASAQTASTPASQSLPQATQSSRPAAAAFPDSARLAYVDINRVAALSGEGKVAAAKLEALRSKKSTEVSERGKQLEALQQKLTQGAAVLNDVTRARLQREFERAQTDFQRFTEDAQAEVQATQQQLLQAFTSRLFPVIRQVATEKNLWAVFSSESGLLWHNPALDLSEEIATRLDAGTPPKQ